MRAHKVVFLSGYSNHVVIFSKVIQEIEKLSDNVKCLIFEIPSSFKEELPFHRRIFDKERILFARTLIEREQPDLIVTPGDQGINATFIKISRRLEIPTLAVQDGILTEKERNENIADILRMGGYLPWHVLSLFSRIPVIARLSLFLGWRIRCLDWGLGGADRIAVIGEYTKRLFVKRRIHPNRIVVTGYPLFDDAINKIRNFEKQNISQELGFRENEKLIVLATQPFVEDGIWSPVTKKTFIKSVNKAVKRAGFLRLVIKLHPREDMDEYSALVQGVSEPEVVLIKNFDLHKLLLASDCVLTVSSTVGIWALVYKKPLIAINCFPTAYHNLYTESAFTVNDLKDLPTLIKNAVKDPGRKSLILLRKSAVFLHDNVYKLDGQASKRIAELILWMVKQN